jgi:hypothetical protein
MIAPAGLSYQWKRNGVNIVDSPPRVTGASTPELVLDPALLSDSDVYTVVIDDATRAIVESNPLTLTVYPLNSLSSSSIIFSGLVLIVVCILGVLAVRKNAIIRKDV